MAMQRVVKRKEQSGGLKNAQGLLSAEWKPIECGFNLFTVIFLMKIAIYGVPYFLRSHIQTQSAQVGSAA